MFMHFSDDKNEPDMMDENYEWIWKIRIIFNELSDSYATYYSPTEYAAVVKLLCYLKVESFSNNVYQRNTKGLGSKFTNFVILRNIHTIWMCIR